MQRGNTDEEVKLHPIVNVADISRQSMVNNDVHRWAYASAMFCDTIQKISEYGLITRDRLFLYYSLCMILRNIDIQFSVMESDHPLVSRSATFSYLVLVQCPFETTFI